MRRGVISLTYLGKTLAYTERLSLIPTKNSTIHLRLLRNNVQTKSEGENYYCSRIIFIIHSLFTHLKLQFETQTLCLIYSCSYENGKGK